jgi:hypothetical protein
MERLERANNARLQVIPSITAPAATIKMATVAVSVVTAVAIHRQRRSRFAREGATCGKANNIAGRVSTGIEPLQTSNQEKGGSLYALQLATERIGVTAQNILLQTDTVTNFRRSARTLLPQFFNSESNRSQFAQTAVDCDISLTSS